MGNLLRKVEDAWYHLLDQIDPIIPVYRIVDPIDKWVPSFLVFFLLVGIALIAVLFPLFSLASSSSGTVTILATSEGDHAPISGVEIQLKDGGRLFTKITGADGKATFSTVPFEKTLFLAATGEGFESVEKTLSFSARNPTFEVALTEIRVKPEPWSIILADSHHQLITGKNGSVSISCEDGQSVPIESETIGEGYFTVTPEHVCITYWAEINLEGYDPLSHVKVSPENPSISLPEKKVEQGKMTLMVVSSSGQRISGIRVQAFKENNVLTGETFSNALGLASLVLPAGDYFFSMSDPEGKYGVETTTLYELLPNQTKEETIELSAATVGGLSIQVNDIHTQKAVKQAIIRITGAQTNIPFLETVTNEDGEIPPIGFTQKGTYRIIVQHPDYLTVNKEFTLVPGETTTIPILLTPATSENSGIIHATLVTENKNPISSASVQLIKVSGGSEPPLEFSGKITDGEGKVSFTGMESGNYILRASKGF
ncbi:MAG: hypothetical protein AABX02_02605, partial [archaeon]